MSNYLIAIPQTEKPETATIHDSESKLKIKAFDIIRSKFKPRKGEVLLYDQLLKLTKHEFTLLYHFMENPNIVLSREHLIDQLYPHADRTVLDRTIDAHIKKLRGKIEENPSSPKRILTVRGMGYQFVSE